VLRCARQNVKAADQGVRAEPPERFERFREAGRVNQAELLVENLLPIKFACRRARDVVTEACLRWDLTHLTGSATLIVTELVSNVIKHAHTMMTLTVILRDSDLYLAVEDGSYDLPELNLDVSVKSGGGRGLLLISTLGTAWGFVADHRGKTVWASLDR
jgi:anti-sigma regulatory factor (Ser/Thr protein kinase)